MSKTAGLKGVNLLFPLALLLGRVALGFLLVVCFRPSPVLAQIPESYGIDLGIPSPLNPSTTKGSSRASGRGEVFDREALRQAKSFCVDAGHLEGPEADEVKEFVEEEGKPGKLLSRLPWRLIDDCAKADAVARIYFAPVEVTDVTEDKGSGIQKKSPPRQFSQPVLLIYDKASIRLFYRAEGLIASGDSMKIMASPFSMLIKDLKTKAQ
jgi:hypothetical protein